MKTYICPHCKEKQYTVIQWHTTSVGYEQNLKGDLLDNETLFSEHSDFETFACKNCGKNLEESDFTK